MTLTTERLLLREFTMDDVPSLYALESIPEVVRYHTYVPRTLGQAREVVAEIVRGQEETPRRHVELAVFHRDAFLGRVGAWDEDGTAALWYALLPGAQGHGYATEAMSALIPTWTPSGSRSSAIPATNPPGDSPSGWASSASRSPSAPTSAKASGSTRSSSSENEPTSTASF